MELLHHSGTTNHIQQLVRHEAYKSYYCTYLHSILFTAKKVVNSQISLKTLKNRYFFLFSKVHVSFQYGCKDVKTLINDTWQKKEVGLVEYFPHTLSEILGIS